MSGQAGLEARTPAASTADRAQSVDALLKELAPDLLRYFVTRLDDTEDAADALADTLFALWRRARSVPSDHEGARRYAFGVARKVLSTVRRGAVRRSALVVRMREVLRDDQAMPVEPDIELRTALGSLPAKDRELVLLVAWDGFSIAEAGRVLGLKPEAARARYSRARARLRRQLS